MNDEEKTNCCNYFREPQRTTRSRRGRPFDRRQFEHQVGDDASDGSTDGLRNHVQPCVARCDRTQQSIDDGDRGVEMRTGHSAEHQDQANQGAGCCGRVLEQLKSGVVG